MTIMTGADLSCQPWRRRGLATCYIILTLFFEASSGAGREDIGLMGGGTSATSASSASAVCGSLGPASCSASEEWLCLFPIPLAETSTEPWPNCDTVKS